MHQKIQKVTNWLKENLSAFFGFTGTLLMSFAMAGSQNGGEMKKELWDAIKSDPTNIDISKGNWVDPFVILKHPLQNQIGLVLICIAFILPYYWRSPCWGKLIMMFVTLPIFTWLIVRFA